ncbi:TPA: CcdB family protein [Providencia alcalifaciens]
MQYCVYQAKKELTNYPYLLDVQSNIIDDLTTRLIIPLFDTRHLQTSLPIRLNPIIDIEGQPFVLMTHLMSAISKSMLGKEIICIEYQRDKIKSAIDLLVNGF